MAFQISQSIRYKLVCPKVWL